MEKSKSGLTMVFHDGSSSNLAVEFADVNIGVFAFRLYSIKVYVSSYLIHLNDVRHNLRGQLVIMVIPSSVSSLMLFYSVVFFFSVTYYMICWQF